ncbi:MAG: hypothetical protein M3291_01245 [Actinomycetota bacterium]|nr:hypothetical protein [Actinomycetota bacterium]
MPTVEQILHRNTVQFTTITCAVEGSDHLVSNLAVAAGLTAGHGRYTAACGHVVVAAPMVAPQGPLCLDCGTARPRISADRSAPSTRRSRHRRRGVLARLLRRNLLPAHSQSGADRRRAATP